MLTVTYYAGLVHSVTEYLCVAHEGFAGNRDRALLATIAGQCGGRVCETLDDTAAAMTAGKHPASITYKKEGKFYNVYSRTW